MSVRMSQGYRPSNFSLISRSYVEWVCFSVFFSSVSVVHYFVVSRHWVFGLAPFSLVIVLCSVAVYCS